MRYRQYALRLMPVDSHALEDNMQGWNVWDALVRLRGAL